jgi:hypothetical protein
VRRAASQNVRSPHRLPIGEDVAQPGEEIADRSQHADRAVAILDVGAVHLGADQEPVGVRDDVALAPIDLLAGVVPARSARSRACWSRTRLIRSHSPSVCHA